MQTPEHLSELLGDLMSLSNRLTRLAATATGSTESPAIWRTLAVLRDRGPMRLGELAQASRVSQPTMTKLVHTLDERDWIRRIADASDARAWLISADARGIRALDAWRDELVAVIAPQFDDLDADDLDALARATSIMRERLERADEKKEVA